MAEDGRTYCRRHLDDMNRRALERRNERICQGLCTYCGTRPQFWGVRCIICRQRFEKDSLPRGARKALRVYREAEAQREARQIRHEVRVAAAQVLVSGHVRGKRAEALRLYVGLDNGLWRTYEEVGNLMNVSGERVRQLLLPSKVALTCTLGDRVPWRPVDQDSGDQRPCNFAVDNRTTESARDVKINSGNHGVQRWTPLRGLGRATARQILCKRSLLTGHELRFLRTSVSLTTLELAERLDVVDKTILAWEASPFLRYTNDLAVRVVIGSLLDEVDNTFASLSNAVHSCVKKPQGYSEGGRARDSPTPPNRVVVVARRER